ncbi:MAG TPA: DUF169 domain-containing protein [Bacteroidales bacterium]|nr:DUF169 domain-containing protein [Bacteroidales bacterium]
MDISFRNDFLNKWATCFGGCELPITFFYSDDPGGVALANVPAGRSCIVCELALVRKGHSLAWHTGSIGCTGARRYLGFSNQLRPDFEYFLSTGIEGRMEGEKYIKTPEMVRDMMASMPCIPALGKYIIFKRFDQLTPEDEPLAVSFFARPDVLSGLFTLANFDRPAGDAVIAPFGSGCGTLVHQALIQAASDDPKAVLGMFDPSARSCVPKEVLSFTVPMKKFTGMVANMEESFLTTSTWEKVKSRL